MGLPRDLVPMDGPPGEPALILEWEGGGIAARAKLNGRNYRRMLKQINDHGTGNVVVVLQGTLRPPTAPGGPFVLEGAGFQVNSKAEKPAVPPPTPAPTPPPPAAPLAGRTRLARAGRTLATEIGPISDPN